MGIFNIFKKNNKIDNDKIKDNNKNDISKDNIDEDNIILNDIKTINSNLNNDNLKLENNNLLIKDLNNVIDIYLQNNNESQTINDNNKSIKKNKNIKYLLGVLLFVIIITIGYFYNNSFKGGIFNKLNFNNKNTNTINNTLEEKSKKEDNLVNNSNNNLNGGKIKIDINVLGINSGILGLFKIITDNSNITLDELNNNFFPYIDSIIYSKGTFKIMFSNESKKEEFIKLLNSTNIDLNLTDNGKILTINL